MPEEKVAGATVISLLVFFSYVIVLNTVVPISLYVSVEVYCHNSDRIGMIGATRSFVCFSLN